MIRFISMISFSTVESPYTNLEIIFWYCAFVVILIAFIFFVRKHGSNKKKIAAVSGKLQKEISRYDEIVRSMETKPGGEKIRQKEIGTKTLLVLDSFDIVFIELKEKTRLGDFDRLMAEKEKLAGKIRGLFGLEGDQLLEKTKEVRDELIRYKGQVELASALVKK